MSLSTLCEDESTSSSDDEQSAVSPEMNGLSISFFCLDKSHLKDYIIFKTIIFQSVHTLCIVTFLLSSTCQYRTATTHSVSFLDEQIKMSTCI